MALAVFKLCEARLMQAEDIGDVMETVGHVPMYTPKVIRKCIHI